MSADHTEHYHDDGPRLRRLWHSRRDGDLIAGWLDAISTAPDLQGASCKGSADWDWDRHGEMPDARDARLAAAVAACQRCPVLERCRRYRDGLPPNRRPAGAFAGEIAAPGVRGVQQTRRGVSRSAASEAVARGNDTDPAPNVAQRATQPATGTEGATV